MRNTSNFDDKNIIIVWKNPNREKSNILNLVIDYPGLRI